MLFFCHVVSCCAVLCHAVLSGCARSVCLLTPRPCIIFHAFLLLRCLTLCCAVPCCAVRVRKKRMFIDPKTLVPKLPKPRDLQPFPNSLSMCYSGHTGRVRSISPHPGKQCLLWHLDPEHPHICCCVLFPHTSTHQAFL
jgi:hypothetical protein